MVQNRRAILFVAWGESYVSDVFRCIDQSRLPGYPVFLVTDESTAVPDRRDIEIIRVSFFLEGKARKAEMIDHLPEKYDSFLFLDHDTRVLEEIEMGFQKAEQHGMAIAPAPHYSLDHFRGFGDIMKKEGMSLSGQLQYNTGVIFFTLASDVVAVLERWKALANSASFSTICMPRPPPPARAFSRSG